MRSIFIAGLVGYGRRQLATTTRLGPARPIGRAAIPRVEDRRSQRSDAASAATSHQRDAVSETGAVCRHAGWAPVSFQHYQAGPQRVGCSELALPLAVNHLAGMSNDAPGATVAPLPAARDPKLRRMANAL